MLGRNVVRSSSGLVRIHVNKRITGSIGLVKYGPLSSFEYCPTGQQRFHGTNKLSEEDKQRKKFWGWERRIGAQPGGIPEFLEYWTRDVFYKTGGVLAVGSGASLVFLGPSFGSISLALFTAGFWAIGLNDIKQEHHSIRRNFPFLGHMRYLLESIRPEIRQYFIESDHDSKPFSREQRSVVYQRAKGMPDTQAFGTRRDVYLEGYEWISHSLWPKVVKEEHTRILIGNDACKQKYSASRLNISAMSYGALSDNAILALNEAAKKGNFYHNTGEGGISQFHLRPGGDIVWNIGTGYFGCRDPKTKGFDPIQFQERASDPRVKMIEIKLSQGAKPAHGGMLPGEKVTEAIAHARGIKVGETCNSPPFHSAFSDSRGLLQFVERLRDLSGGKPVGFKLCMGRPVEIAMIIGAMVEMEVYPDFITVDGSEGGTGAAPPEFSNHVGFPLTDALTFINQMLIGAGIRQHVKIIASGKVLSGFSMVRTVALGADVLNSARAMMFALGCIQSLKCDTNKCPTGVATQDKNLMYALHVPTKAERVATYHKKTLHTFHEMIGAIGLDNPRDLKSSHVMLRLAGGTYSKSYAEIFPPLESKSLLTGAAIDHPSNIQMVWDEGQVALNKRLANARSIPLKFAD